MKLIRERFRLLISLLFTVLLFAFLISNFPFAADVDGNGVRAPQQEPLADASVKNGEE
jgi:hypothetical protein